MGFIYLIMEVSDEERYKIGRTNTPIEQRMGNLQTGNPNELVLLDSFETKNPVLLEKMLHVKYRNKNVLNEWFDLDMDDIKGFQETCRRLDETIKSLKDNKFISIK